MRNYIHVWKEKEYGQFMTYKTPIITDCVSEDFTIDDMPESSKYFKYQGVWYEIYERLYLDYNCDSEVHLIVFELERDGEIMKTVF